MAVPALQSPGLQGAGTNGVLLPYPASVAVGDTLLALIAGKYPPNRPTLATVPAGWEPGGYVDCTANTSPSADNGDVYAFWAWKVADAGDVALSAASSSASFGVWPGAGNSMVGIMQRFTTTAGKIVGFDAAYGTVGTESSVGQTINFSPDLSWATNDLAAVVFAGNTDMGGYAQNGSGIVIAGSTRGITTEQSANATSMGDDCKLEMHRASITSGGGSGAASVTFTVGGVATATAAILLRLREIDPPLAAAVRGRSVGGSVWPNVWPTVN